MVSKKTKMELQKQLQRRRAFLIMIMITLALSVPIMLNISSRLGVGIKIQVALFFGFLVSMIYCTLQVHKVENSLSNLSSSLSEGLPSSFSGSLATQAKIKPDIRSEAKKIS